MLAAGDCSERLPGQGLPTTPYPLPPPRQTSGHPLTCAYYQSGSTVEDRGRGFVSRRNHLADTHLCDLAFMRFRKFQVMMGPA
jgi:hypothetical protein